MELIDLIFRIIEKFVPIEQPALIAMRNEIMDWRAGIEKPGESEKTLNRLYLRINRPWGFRLLFAVLYLPIVKWLSESDRSEDPRDDF